LNPVSLWDDLVLFCTKPWVHRAPGIPCALFFMRREMIDAKLGRMVSREREGMPEASPMHDGGLAV
jgi:hypothetical protein